jgi:hypothetical protein
MGGVAGRGRGSLPSQAGELAREAAEWWAKAGDKVGFIREKGKATGRQVPWNLETGNSLLR